MESLKNLTKLRSLDIANTDIDSGLDFLSENIEEIYCSDEERSESRVKEIKSLLEESDFFIVVNDDEGEDKYEKRQNIQQSFDKNYPDDSRSKMTEVNLSKLYFNEEGGLSINGDDFPNLKKLKTSIELFKLKSLSVENCKALKEMEISYSEDNEELKVENCENLTDLNCSNSNLTNLTINNCPKLEKIICSNNQLKKINLQGLSNLIQLDCSDNQLTELLNIEKCEKLTKLNIDKNDELTSSFSSLVKLFELKNK